MKLLDLQGNLSELKGKFVTKNFPVTESRFVNDTLLYGDCIICGPLFEVIQKYRDLKGLAVSINALNRSREKQEQLIADGFRAAKVSPHEYFLAADIDTISWEDTQASVKLLRQAAKEVGYKIRLGWKDYWNKDKSTFIHVDVCPEYFANGKVWYGKKHPIQWESAIEW